MSKPAIFISHSSKDDGIVRALSKALRGKTGQTVEIFVSSDGQSIPLGRNWVHSIEEALDRASLMFVMLSPNSIGSQWIYFEAGYSYSQKRRVIPIGLPGVDLGVLSPPMSLLQGFNVTGPESLNNLLFLINKEFEHAHDATFTQAEYDAIFGQVLRSVDPLLREFVDWTDHIRISMRVRFEALKPYVEQVLASNGIGFQSDEFEVVSYGVRYRGQFTYPRDVPFEDRTLEIDLDPSLATRNLEIFQKIIASYVEETHTDTLPEVNLQIFFAPWAEYLTQIHRLTAKLPKSGIGFGKHNDLIWEGRSFYLSRSSDYNSPDADHVERTQLNVYLPADELIRYSLLGLLRTLVHHNILFAGNVL